MILLPTPPRQVTVRAFGIVAGGFLGIVTGAVSGLLGIAGPAVAVAAGAVAALLGAATAWLRPGAFESVYGVWNRAAKRCARVTNLWLSGVCFLVVTVAGLAGSRMTLRATRGSGWVQHRTVPPQAYRSPSRAERDAGAGSVRSMVAWARESASLWALALVPLLGLIQMVETSEKGSLGGNVYTLY